MRNDRISILVLLISTGAVGILNAQTLGKNGFRLDSRASTADSRIASGGINDLICRNRNVWAAHGEGLSLTSDGGSAWKNIGQGSGLGKGGVSALDTLGGIIWAATGYDTLTEDAGNLPAGGGVGYSKDGGDHWNWTSQPRDSRTETRYNPTTTHIQNITYDIALARAAGDTALTVWIASFGGGLRKSSDWGRTWEVVTVDGAPFNPGKILSHRAFSVIFDGEALWAGTAGGLHKSVDNGKTWTTFNHRNQNPGISGNFVVAIAKQKTLDRDIVWAATVETTSESNDSTEYRAVSKSEDGGLTWSRSAEWKKYEWPDGTEAIFTNWATGEPSDHSKEMYASIHLDPAQKGKWTDEVGDSANLFGIVEVENGDLPDDGWKINPINNHRYKITLMGTIWAKADSEAVSWGGYLVSINDTQEQRWIEDTFGGIQTDVLCFWIGLIRAGRFFPHNFAFDGSTVYVAADGGLFKSPDYGETWAVFPSIRDRETDEPVYATETNCAAVDSGRALWVGTSDGLAKTDDGGNTWKVFRAFETPGQAGQPATYAYPNPFSPFRDNTLGGDGHVRFQYRTGKPTRVTVRVYDFGMNLVRNVSADRERPVPGDYSEAWDGRNDFGDMSANGVYFYRIDVSGESPIWGKVIVMN